MRFREKMQLIIDCELTCKYKVKTIKLLIEAIYVL